MSFYVTSSALLSALNLVQNNSLRRKTNKVDIDDTIALISDINQQSLTVCSHCDSLLSHINIKVATKFSPSIQQDFAITVSSRQLANFIRKMKATGGIDIDIDFKEQKLSFFHAVHIEKDLLTDASINRIDAETVHRLVFNLVHSKIDFLIEPFTGTSTTSLTTNDIHRLGNAVSVLKSLTTKANKGHVVFDRKQSDLRIFATNFQFLLSDQAQSEQSFSYILDLKILKTFFNIANAIGSREKSLVSVHTHPSYLALYSSNYAAHIHTLPHHLTPRQLMLADYQRTAVLEVPIRNFKDSINKLCEPTSAPEDVITVEQISASIMRVSIKIKDGESIQEFHLSQPSEYPLPTRGVQITRKLLLSTLDIFEVSHSVQLIVVGSAEQSLVMTETSSENYIFLGRLENRFD